MPPPPDHSSDACTRWALGGTLLVALALRLHRIQSTPVLFGDAFAYATVARQWAAGDYASIDLGYFTFFSFVPMLLQRLGVSAHASVVSVSLAAGVVAVVLTFLLARQISRDDRVSLTATALVAVHPRLVQFSAEGYTESLLTAVVLAAALAFLRSAASRRQAGRVGAFALFAIAFLIRNDTVFYLPLLLLATFLVCFYGSGWPLRRASTAALLGLLVYAAVALTPIALMGSKLGSWPIFSKAAANLNLAVNFDPNRLQSWREDVWSLEALAAREGGSPEIEPRSVADRLRKAYRNYDILLRFYFNRFLFWPPLLLFAGLGMAAPIAGGLASRWLPLAAIATVHVAYIPVIVEPKLLLQCLPMLLVFAALGVDWATRRMWEGYRRCVPGPHWPFDQPRLGIRRSIASVFAAGLLVPLGVQAIGLTLTHAEKRPVEIRRAAEWLRSHADPDLPVFGATPAYGFYSGLRFERLPVDENPNAVLEYLEGHGSCILAVPSHEPLALRVAERAGWSLWHRVEGRAPISLHGFTAR